MLKIYLFCYTYMVINCVIVLQKQNSKILKWVYLLFCTLGKYTEMQYRALNVGASAGPMGFKSPSSCQPLDFFSKGLSG